MNNTDNALKQRALDELKAYCNRFDEKMLVARHGKDFLKIKKNLSSYTINNIEIDDFPHFEISYMTGTYSTVDYNDRHGTAEYPSPFIALPAKTNTARPRSCKAALTAAHGKLYKIDEKLYRGETKCTNEYAEELYRVRMAFGLPEGMDIRKIYFFENINECENSLSKTTMEFLKSQGWKNLPYECELISYNKRLIFDDFFFSVNGVYLKFNDGKEDKTLYLGYYINLPSSYADKDEKDSFVYWPDRLNPYKQGCYIATSVYGSYDCPQVWTLRRYRDFTLKNSLFGRAFIKMYYAVSPTVVKLFGKMKWFNSFWKKKLDKKVARLNAKGVDDTPYND